MRKPPRPWLERKAEVLAKEARAVAWLNNLVAQAEANPDPAARPRPGWTLHSVSGVPRRQIWERRVGDGRVSVVFGNGKPGMLWTTIVHEDGKEEYSAEATSLGMAMAVAELHGTGKLIEEMQHCGSA